MPSVDSVLQRVSKWSMIIKADMEFAYYQLGLARTSMKYCGVVSPFKGIYCYNVAAVGMPGSENG